jgi:hypothetical protein
VHSRRTGNPQIERSYGAGILLFEATLLARSRQREGEPQNTEKQSFPEVGFSMPSASLSELKPSKYDAAARCYPLICFFGKIK